MVATSRALIFDFRRLQSYSLWPCTRPYSPALPHLPVATPFFSLSLSQSVPWDAGWHPKPATCDDISQPWDTKTQGCTREWLRELRDLMQHTLEQVSQLCQSEMWPPPRGGGRRLLNSSGKGENYCGSCIRFSLLSTRLRCAPTSSIPLWCQERRARSLGSSPGLLVAGWLTR
jgi:hypothetical protein